MSVEVVDPAVVWLDRNWWTWNRRFSRGLFELIDDHDGCWCDDSSGAYWEEDWVWDSDSARWPDPFEEHELMEEYVDD